MTVTRSLCDSCDITQKKAAMPCDYPIVGPSHYLCENIGLSRIFSGGTETGKQHNPAQG